MTYILGQIFGLLGAVGVVVSLQMKKKWQILAVSVFVNICGAVNILLLDQFNSGVLLNLLACLQIGATTWHEHKEIPIPLWEKLVFLGLYLTLGIVGYARPLDLLSILAAVFYMCSVFQKKEQNVRLFLLGNMTTWAVYHAILGSTSLIAQLAGIASSLIALWRYKKTKR